MKLASTLFGLGLFLTSCSSSGETHREAQPQATTSTQSREGPAVEESRTISTVATVEELDRQNRTITLRGPSGNDATFEVGEHVKNLDQVKVGDRVVVDYYESLAIQVVKPGSSANGGETVIDSTQPGEKPAKTLAHKSTMIATVEQIDYATPSITLRGSEGNLMTVKVRHPERLKLVKVGDTLRITYQLAIAVSVKPAPNAAR